MDNELKIKMYSFTLECKDPHKLAKFYEEPEAQQQMAHIDFAVNDLEKAVQYAIHRGATIADEQFSDNWRVMFDPDGHPFCLCHLNIS